VYFYIFAGVGVVGVCVLVYARTHTQTTWVLDVSPGVGQTPGEPEESRSTKAQYTQSFPRKNAELKEKFGTKLFR